MVLTHWVQLLKTSVRGLIFLQKKQYKMTYYELEVLLTPLLREPVPFLEREVGGVFLKSCYSEYY